MAVRLEIDTKMEVYLPNIDTEKCNECGLCVKVCPGNSVDFRRLTREIFGEPQCTLEEVLLGKHGNCYTGYSTDHKIRYNSSSGGLVTQLLIFALEERMIDGALVTKMNDKNPTRPQPFIARTPEEIVEASKSKYCPVPANVAAKEILDRKGKYATVGLPCHVQGLRKASQFNKELRERIALCLGLFCSHGESFSMTDCILHRFGIKIEDVARIDYRGKGWPGTLTVKLNSEIGVDCPFSEWIVAHRSQLFTPSRCLLCCDETAELADISFGDAWLPEFSKDRIGTSIAVVRTSIGERVLQEAMLKKKIELRKLDCNKVIRSQGKMHFKKNGLRVRFFMTKLQGKMTPVYAQKLPKPNLIDYIYTATIFASRHLVSNSRSLGTINSLTCLTDLPRRIYLRAMDSR
jgi:coenzyme F420 hydrogenase subunit beta